VWTAADVQILLDSDLSDGALVTVRILTPAGALLAMGNIVKFDRELVLSGVHMHGETLRANGLGGSRLRQIARAVAEIVDVDTIVIAGAARTSGAHPGRFPRPLRFAR
jgi:hypothetical protein